MKNKTNECKMRINYFLGYSIAKSTVYVSLMFIKFEKTTSENFYFVHLLSFFLSLLNLTQKQ